MTPCSPTEPLSALTSPCPVLIGSFDGFSLDITDLLHLDGSVEELRVLVYDPSDRGPQPQGKQRVSAATSPGGVTYTSVSGIWQTVWLEAVPAEAHISSLQVVNGEEEGEVVVRVTATAVLPVEVVVWQPEGGVEGERREAVVRVSGVTGPEGVRVVVPTAHRRLWSPESPVLYPMTVRLLPTTTTAQLLQHDDGWRALDSVESYFGLRTIRLGLDEEGVLRPLLNGRFSYLAGWLDQVRHASSLTTAWAGCCRQ